MSSPRQDKLVESNDPTLAWDLLSERIEALVSAWEESTEPPALADFLPERPPVLRRLALIELIKVDLDYRCQRPQFGKQIEAYVADFPELVDGGAIPCDLIYEEYHVRKLAGQAVDVQEYFERFPGQAAELGRLLGMESPHLSTSLHRGARFEEIEVGEQLDEFDLLTRLGRGAFATVFLARQQSMQRIVALKVSADRGNEPQTMALLDHPHIVRVFDQRYLTERKLRLLYMQYIPGGTLQAVVDAIRNAPPAMRNGQRLLEVIDQALVNRGESPPTDSQLRARLHSATWPQVVCWLGARLASALDYAHQRGVLHRDVKPANVLVAADGSPKLADFNISFCSKVEGSSAAAYFGGSLAYMSPEQLEACDPAHDRAAEELDGRSDVYSLGVVLWELLSGGRPFRDGELEGEWSTTLPAMARRRRAGVSAPAIASLPADCPLGLKQILLTCLAPEAADRFATAGQLSRQLELCLQPQVQRLLRPRPGSWRNWARRYPLSAMFAAGLLPNIVASALNLAYNLKAVFESLGKSVWDVAVDPAVTAINSVAYAVGIGILLPFVWPVVRAVARLHRRRPRPEDRAPRLRRRCFVLPDLTAGVSGAEWMISGLVYPTWLAQTVGAEGFNTSGVYTHFLASQVLCGLMASTLAFFFVCFLSMRVFYPTLFQTDGADAASLARVRGLERRTWFYFIMAIIVPPLAIVTMVMLESMTGGATGSDSAQLPATTFAILGLVGLFNSVLVFLLWRGVQKDLAALAVAASPAGTVSFGGDTDTLSDSFWK